MNTFSDQRIKHLEMVQSVISRMSQNSFSLKGWTTTLVAGIFTLSEKDESLTFLSISYVPIVLFWFLDSYYLQTERRYRILYDNLIRNAKSDKRTSFNLTPAKPKWRQKTHFIQSLCSITELPFYFILGVFVTIIIYIK